MRRSTFPFLFCILIIGAIIAQSYLAMAIDQKLMSKPLIATLMIGLAIGMIIFIVVAFKFYKKNPQSLTYKIRDLPFNISKLPIDIQQMIAHKVDDDKITQKIEELFVKHSKTVHLLIAYAYFTYNFGKKVMLDEVHQYCQKALGILEEAKQYGEELVAIDKLKNEITTTLNMLKP